MTYPFGWSVVPQLQLQRERWSGEYTLKGTPLVYPGQTVLPDQPVIRLAQSGFAIHDETGRMMGSDMLPAGLYGQVIDLTRRGGVLIESRVALVQGTIGAGKQVAGKLTLWKNSSAQLEGQVLPPGAILVVPGPLPFALLHQAVTSGVLGIVASSIALKDLEGFVRTDFLQLIDNPAAKQAQLSSPPITLLLTEGLGAVSMPAYTLDLLRRYQGSIALLSGVISVQEDIFPELLISLPLEEVQKHWQPVQPDPDLLLGTLVRVCGGQYAGVSGLIDYFFSYEQKFPSGMKARAVRLRCSDGSFCTVPLAQLERVS